MRQQKQQNVRFTLSRILTVLGFGLFALAIPLTAQAGGVHVSVGFELPLPVAVVPAPVVVTPAPVIVQRAPIVIQQPPVVLEERRVVYRDHLPPGLAKKIYRDDYRYWRHHHHHHHDED